MQEKNAIRSLSDEYFNFVYTVESKGFLHMFSSDYYKLKTMYKNKNIYLYLINIEDLKKETEATELEPLSFDLKDSKILKPYDKWQFA